MRFKNRVGVRRASIDWANALVVEHHYLHRAIHQRACPFAYEVTVDGDVAGVIIMATPHFTRQRGLFGYPGFPTKWQVLVIARLWLYPRVQGLRVLDSHGVAHSFSVASCALAKMLRVVQKDWLLHHPPRYPDEPYHIRLIMAYADTGVGHEGTIYKAANFERFGVTKNVRRRHSTCGGHSGSEKILYVYRLPRPAWIAPVLPIELPWGTDLGADLG